MHISSLPSPYGVGTLGKAARDFADFLEKAGQSYWQTLPICPTSYGDSPYQSYSTYAGNPYFIDLDLLEHEGLLHKEEFVDTDWDSAPDQINYGALYEKRFPILRKAAARFQKRLMAPGNMKQIGDSYKNIDSDNSKNADGDKSHAGEYRSWKSSGYHVEGYRSFCQENAFWLDDYAVYMTLKGLHGGSSFMDWELPYRSRDPEAINRVRTEYAGELEFWKILQFFFFTQWHDLHAYCGSKGIAIIGDMPFYVALDSVDVWAHPELFLLDEDLVPVEIAGVPPDGFSENGQLWGNPVYRWEEHKKTGYKWWIQKIDYLCREYDVLRIDHFRGFDSYYTVPYEAETARGGRWNPGPGKELFEALNKAIGPQRIIAEDLGYTTPAVKQLLTDTGFPGMKILQFGFDERDESSPDHRPHTYPVNCVAYTGTHDNDTLQGWMENAPAENIAFAKDYLRLYDPDNYHWDMIKALYTTPAAVTIVQMQDILGLGSDCRMNVPSTMGGNWCWRMKDGMLDDALAGKLKSVTKLYERG